jgi:hypothetical protein
MKKHTIACAALAASAIVSPAAVIDFDDLAVPVSGYENGEHLAGGFTSAARASTTSMTTHSDRIGKGSPTRRSVT